MASMSGRLRELLKKYGKVGVGVHCTVSAASISGLYIAIRNNVDVESLLHKVGLGGSVHDDILQQQQQQHDVEFISSDDLPPPAPEMMKKKNRTAELVASGGGAFALALLCNKALFLVRVPITFLLTPPIARFLARRNIIRSGL